ncbi:peroxidase family protein [Falsiroseomonas oryzae]|uniref:peroxidase family protein n=1 Tax=Falsiroseomonas oryzae TaxID=2766473 RepID=UPI0022EAA9A6|nr:heme peroxidase family protein [Roseomonas sp. MO-31]
MPETAPTTATTEPGHHGRTERHDIVPPLGTTAKAGRFGRMFPELDTPLDVPDAALVELGLAMVDGARGRPSGDNENIPAGYTYLGQFVDHDITLDTTTLSEMAEDPTAVWNFRTPGLDLDSVYGSGPRAQPSMYDRDSKGMGGDPAPVKLLLGLTSKGAAEDFSGLPHDLPRNAQGFAIIGDERNDENLLVAQTHVAFLRFHNAVARKLDGKVPRGRLFDETRRAVVDLYQAMVLRDFVAKLCDVNDIAAAVDRRDFFRFEQFGPGGTPYIPVEFSAAAYRLGHSMVREIYNHNRIFRPGNAPLPPANFALLFLFTAKSGQIGRPGGTPTFPGDWIIDWRRFVRFEGDVGTSPGLGLNLSRNIDPYLAEELHLLGVPPAPPPAERKPAPDGSTSLAVMNLRRGMKMRLPAAQDIAKRMRIESLSPAQIGDDTPDGRAARRHGLHERTPLWYYILKEAHVTQRGARLGPLGSRIVAETFVGLLDGDPASILGRNPTWRFGDPVPGLALPGADRSFTFADLLRVAATDENGKLDLSPIG